MVQDYEDILKCLRNKTLDELTGVQLDTPSFLTGMGPSRDGVLIPADFGADYFVANRKRSMASPYQVSLYYFSYPSVQLTSVPFIIHGVKARNPGKKVIFGISHFQD